MFKNFLEEIYALEKEQQPCQKPYKYSNKISKKVQRALIDLDQNRSHSLAIELFNRNKNNLDKIALFYRGTKITYYEMFKKAYLYAKSLKSLGFTKESEIPICITNTPEFIYLFLASLFIGAKAHIVGDWFNKDYLTNILNKTKSKVMFVDDLSFNKIKESIEKSNIENIVCLSLTNSLKHKQNPYNKIDDKFQKIEDNYNSIKKSFNGYVEDEKEFLNHGNSYQGKVLEKVDLNDVCTITYTSGTTKPGEPKGVIQSHRSYITLSRFKESDVSGMPTMKNMSVLAHIPTYTHMELSCAISDTLFCGCTLALEPFYNQKFFPYSLVINKPNFVPASVGFWSYLCKLLNFDKSWQKVNMPYLMLPTVTGEACSSGEEKFFNYTSRKHKFGTAKLAFPLAPVTFSIGGGTTESSGIFVTLFKALQEKKLNHLIFKDSLGLTPHKFAEVEVLDDQGNYCKENEPGLLVAKSPCEMLGYTCEALNQFTHVTSNDKKKWLSLGTLSYKDRTGRIKMKGRIDSYLKLDDDSKIPYYLIEDCILRDTKNILSCSVIKTYDNNLVCHIEFQPRKQKSSQFIIKSIFTRLKKEFPPKVLNNLYYRIRDNVESFPIDPSGKRSISTLKSLSLDEKTRLFIELEKDKRPESVKIRYLKKQ